MRYLSAEEILVIHARVIDVTGGRHGIGDPGLLMSLCNRPRTTLGGTEQFATVFEKAAVYLDSLAWYHVFVDGNKRTAVVCAARFIFLNGYNLTATNTAVERFVFR